MELLLFTELLTLFVSAFISSTLFPGGSELLLIYYLSEAPDNSFSYFIAVTVGNSLGAIVTYFMGYYCYWGRDKAHDKHKKAIHWCQDKGAYALLFSWLPVVGDLLPLAAGWLKVAKFKSLLFIVLGKALRYALIIVSTLYFI